LNWKADKVSTRTILPSFDQGLEFLPAEFHHVWDVVFPAVKLTSYLSQDLLCCKFRSVLLDGGFDDELPFGPENFRFRQNMSVLRYGFGESFRVGGYGNH
jgi:hypothetical protein